MSEPNREENRSSSPWFSPGPVQSREIVLRTILDPDHLEPNGKLKVATIPLQDIRFRGWSVDRKLFTSPWRIRLFHFRWKLRNPQIGSFYVLPIEVSQIRKLNDETREQDFVVTDTAVWLNPAHASVLLSRDIGEGTARRFRNQLLKELPAYVELQEAFETTDKYGFSKGMTAQVGSLVRSVIRKIFPQSRQQS